MSRDIPIIFSAPMVRAMLDGNKTMTRRLATSPLAKAKPGDRLWVRESLTRGQTMHSWQYAATPGVLMTHDWLAHQIAAFTEWSDRQFIMDRKSVPSIHMPRWGSRLMAIVTSIKSEPVQDISEADAVSEGGYGLTTLRNDHPLNAASMNSPQFWFRGLWINLHGAESWESNPVVVALAFQVLRINIDQHQTSP